VSETSPSTAPAPKNKKWLLIIAIAALLAIAITGWFVSKKKSLDGAEPAAPVAQKITSFAAPPVFLPLDSMVVNLADSGGERFVQLGLTLEIANTEVADQLKPWLPHIRSSILLLLSQRSSQELLSRNGKDKLALDIRRAVLRPLGYSISVGTENNSEDSDNAMPENTDEEDQLLHAPHLPVRQVLFSSFIIQ